MYYKTILHVIFSLKMGGSENLMIDMANAQTSINKVVIIIVNADYDEALFSRIHPSIQLILLNRKIGSKNFYKLFLFNKHLIALRPHIIHCHNHNIIPFVLFYSKRAICTIHTLHVPVHYLSKYYKVVAISNAVYNDIVNRSHSNIQPIIINNSIDVEGIKLKKNFELQQPLRIIQVGRLEHTIKGQDTLLRALAQLKKTKVIESVKVSFVGMGSSFKFLEKLVEDLDLQEVVEFLKQKDRTWLYDNLHHYDVLIQPSIYEGFGLTILEAMAAKVPVIASDIDGPSEIIEHEKYGYLFEKNNSDSLANKIVQMVKDYKENKIGKKVIAARATLVQKYSFNTFLKKYNAVYENKVLN